MQTKNFCPLGKITLTGNQPLNSGELQYTVSKTLLCLKIEQLKGLQYCEQYNMQVDMQQVAQQAARKGIADGCKSETAAPG